MSKLFGKSSALILLIITQVAGITQVKAGYQEEIIFPTTTPAPYIRSLLNSTDQPTWFTYCVDPPNPNERLITAILGPQTFQAHQSIEMAQKEADKLVAGMNLNKRPKLPGVSRRKRSPVKNYGKFKPDSSKAAILFKKPRYHKQVATKKTSFAAWSPSLVNQAKYKSRHNRFFTAPEVAPIVTTTLAPTTDNNLTKVEKNLIEAGVANNIRLSWSINCALNTCNEPKKAANGLREELAKSLEERQITQADMDEAARNRAKWWPEIDSLIVRARKPGVPLGVGMELEYILANISHYFQFFSVAFEQMEFEEKKGAKWNQFNYLSRFNLKIMCEIDNMITLINSTRSGLVNITELALANLKQRLPASSPLRSLMDPENQGDKFKSPLEKQMEAFKKGDKLAPSDVKLERSVMPLEQRELGHFERDLRNWLVLKDYEKMVAYYALVLSSLYT